MTLFLLACGFAFFRTYARSAGANAALVDWISVPLLRGADACMGSISQEWRRAEDMLMTAPVTDSDVVAGQVSRRQLRERAAGADIYLRDMMSIFSTSHVGPGAIFSGYLGMILRVACLWRVLSAPLTRSQMWAVSAFADPGGDTIVPWLVGAWATLPDFWRGLVNQRSYARYATSARRDRPGSR